MVEYKVGFGKGEVFMKKVDEIMKTIDEQVDHSVMPWVSKIMRKYFVFFSSALIFSLLFIFTYRIVKERPYHMAAVIKSDLEQIEKHLAIIDKECNILAMVSERIPIDFLNIEKFSGSMVGCLNLAYPEKWKGPYLHRNPTLQGTFYDLVKARDGLFIIPGKGVRLPNGLIVEKDIKISHETSVKKLIKQGGVLFYKGEALARMIKFPVGDWDPYLLKDQNFEKVNSALKEFHDALPFTQNEHEHTTA